MVERTRLVGRVITMEVLMSASERPADCRPNLGSIC